MSQCLRCGGVREVTGGYKVGYCGMCETIIRSELDSLKDVEPIELPDLMSKADLDKIEKQGEGLRRQIAIDNLKTFIKRGY